MIEPRGFPKDVFLREALTAISNTNVIAYEDIIVFALHNATCKATGKRRITVKRWLAMSALQKKLIADLYKVYIPMK